MKRLVLSILTLAMFTSIAYAAPVPPSPDAVLATLKKGHPRLMMTDERLAEIQSMRKTDNILDGYIGEVLTKAEKDLGLPALEHKLVGPRLLSVSRECMRRVYSLGLAWRLTGDERFAKALESNLLTVAAFPDWNPSHFLDTAEMSHAVGVGYDWLYGWLSTDSREKIRKGLTTLGLDPGVAAYKGEASWRWWIESYHNWNQVCNAGLSVGALAVAESDPEYAKVIIPSAVESMPRALATYGPDGAWPEGPGYWHYASRYTAFGLCAMRTALGTDFGLSQIEGLSVTGAFPVFTTGPTGLYVNFADSGERATRRCMTTLFWMARTFDKPFYSDAEHAMAEKYGAQPLHVVWYAPPSGKSYDSQLDRLFKGSVELAVFRSAWYDPEALFVGFKAGYNQVNHGHLDLGNFELDALGIRWARDLGSDDYNLPDYWGHDKDATRWTYYRLNSFSHNVVILNGENQDVIAESKFVAFGSKKDSAFGVVDVSTAYAPHSTKSLRGVKIVEGRRAVLVQDEFDLSAATDVAWGMTTDADIAPDGASATLRQDGKECMVKIVEPAAAVFTVESAEQAPPQKRNKGVSRLMIRTKAGAGPCRIAVLFMPVWKDGAYKGTVSVKPLSEW